MSIRHTCQGSPQQSSTSNCVACDLSGVGAGQSTAAYGQAYGPQPGVEARRYVQPQGHAVHPDVAWMNQTLASAPRNPFSWYEEPSKARYGIQGGVAPPGPGYPYPTSINLSSARVAAPSAGGEPLQPTQSPPATVGQQYPPNLGQPQQRQIPANQQSRQQEEAVAFSSQSGKRRSKESRRSTHK